MGTDAFTTAIIERLGSTPGTLRPVQYRAANIQVDPSPTPSVTKELVGIDVFVDWADGDRHPDRIGDLLQTAATRADWKLEMITNRGVKVWPEGLPETFWTDHWRCRFRPTDARVTALRRVIELIQALDDDGVDVIKTEHLYEFDGERGYSLGQGQ